MVQTDYYDTATTNSTNGYSVAYSFASLVSGSNCVASLPCKRSYEPLVKLSSAPRKIESRKASHNPIYFFRRRFDGCSSDRNKSRLYKQKIRS
jgi:hypothetical protein